MKPRFLLICAGGLIVMGLWQIVDGHPFVGLSDFVIAAGCIALSKHVR